MNADRTATINYLLDHMNVQRTTRDGVEDTFLVSIDLPGVKTGFFTLFPVEDNARDLLFKMPQNEWESKFSRLEKRIAVSDRINGLKKEISAIQKDTERIADMVGELAYDYESVKKIIGDRSINPETAMDLAKDIISQEDAVMQRVQERKDPDKEQDHKKDRKQDGIDI